MRLYHQQNSQTENFGIVGIVGFYGWLSTNSGQLPAVAYFLPIGFEILLLLRLIVYRKRMARLALYLAITEERLGLSPGWEGFLRSSRDLAPVNVEDVKTLATKEQVRQTEKNLWQTWRARYITWSVVILASVLVSFYLSLT